MSLTFERYDVPPKRDVSASQERIFLALSFAVLSIVAFVALSIYSDRISGLHLFFLLPCLFPTVWVLFEEDQKAQRTDIYKGLIEFNLEGINWDNERIPWSTITEIDITYHDFKGKYFIQSHLSFEPDFSLGIDNQLSFKIKGGAELKGNFLIENKADIEDLRNLFWQIIRVNPISLANAKKMVRPQSYEEHQLLKSYCGNK